MHNNGQNQGVGRENGTKLDKTTTSKESLRICVNGERTTRDHLSFSTLRKPMMNSSAFSAPTHLSLCRCRRNFNVGLSRPARTAVRLVLAPLCLSRCSLCKISHAHVITTHTPSVPYPPPLLPSLPLARIRPPAGRFECAGSAGPPDNYFFDFFWWAEKT